MMEEIDQDKIKGLWKSKEFNLKVCSLPLSSSDPMQSGFSFIHDTLDLKDVSLQRAWTTVYSTLVLQFRSLDDHL
jgi:hypothetical protein